MALNRNRVFQVSAAAKESSYDGGATIDKRIAVGTGDMPQEVVAVVDDLDTIGGNEEASNQEVMTQNVTHSINIPRVKPFALGFITAYGLGLSESARPNSGSAATTLWAHSNYPHTGDGGVQDSFSFEAWKGTAAGDKYKYSGAMISSFTIGVSGGANRYLSASAEIIASGTRTTADYAAVAEPTESQLSAASSGAWFSTSSVITGDHVFAERSQTLAPGTSDLNAPEDLVAVGLHSWEWTCDNGITADNLYRIGGGNVLAVADRQGRSQTLTVVLDYVNDDEMAALKAQTEYSFQTIIQGDQHASDTGYYYGMNLLFPQIKLQTVTLEERAGKLVWVTVWRVLTDAGSVYDSVYCDVFTDAVSGYGP